MSSSPLNIAWNLGPMLYDAVEKLYLSGVPLDEALEEFHKRWLFYALAQAKGNQSLAARLLHIHRNTLARQLKSLGIVWQRPTKARTRGRSARSEAALPTANSARQGGRRETTRVLRAGSSHLSKSARSEDSSCGRLTEEAS